MDDDEEFGDLYTDVLRPLQKQFQPQTGAHAAPIKAAASQARPIDLNIKGDDEEILYGTPGLKTSNSNSTLVWNLNAPIQEKTHPKPRGFDLNLDSNSEAAEIDDLVVNGVDGTGFEAGVLERCNASSFMEDDDDINIIVEEREIREDLVDKVLDKEEKMYISAAQKENTMNIVNDAAVEEMGAAQIIPGLFGSLENPRASSIEDEWESEESEDDLQIVLNDNSHDQMGMKRIPGAEDRDDEDGEPLVIGAENGDVGHHLYQGQRMMDEQERDGEEGGPGTDGEKDLGDAAKTGGGGDAAPAAVQPKVADSNQVYHHPFPSQFKYVRPGAAPLPGGAPGGIPGQVCPPVNMGLPAGRGRGDWRPAGINGSLGPMQKGFHPGHGSPAWGVKIAGRGYGSGLDFTLPSHKTIFEVDIDSFEEKPWKLSGIIMSDFFNFDLDEDSWRDYCKLLEQLRLGMTMQSKIRVYQSSRAEQDYDPDLPPELAAAAAGIQDNPPENANYGKVDAGPTDLTRADAHERPPLPVGRPIPIEISSGDRLPSTDTRRPRMHDIDTIIEIPCQSSKDGDDMADLQDNDLARKDLGGVDQADGPQQDHTNHMDKFSPAYNGQKREFASKRAKSKNSNDDIVGEDVLPLPPEVNGHSGSDRETGIPHEERSTKGRRHVGSSMVSASENKRGKHTTDDPEEEFHSGDGKRSPALLSSRSTGSGGEQAVAVGHDMNDGSVRDNKSFDMEREEMAVDAPNGVKRENENLMNSSKKQKLSLLVEQLPQGYDDEEDSNAARSVESNKARSGSSTDHQSSPVDVTDEVLQAGDEDNAHRKDHHDIDGGGRQKMVVKGREDSLPNREWRKESDVSKETWHQRDENHRGRTRGEDPRNRGKPRESEKSERNEHHESRNQLDNGNWRGTNHDHHIIGSRQRDRDDDLKSRDERVDDLRGTRRKEEAHIRRVHVEKEDVSHNHRESSIRRKKERDESSNHLKRDNQARLKADVVHYARLKEGGSFQRDRTERQRESDQWYRIKQDEVLSRREKEETHAVMRSVRAAEEKTWRSHSKGNGDYKGSSRDNHPKDVSWQSDQLKQRDRVGNGSIPQHRSHEDFYARGNLISNDEKRARYARASSHDGRSAYDSDTSRVHGHKRKESSRRNKESESGDRSSLIPFKRNQDEDGGLISETENLRGRTKQQSGRNHVNHQLPRKHGEEGSTDDEQPDSRQGRSKLERWTSHKERDSGITSMPSSSLKRRDQGTSNGSRGPLVSRPPEESSKKIEDKPLPLVDNKDTGAEMSNDNPQVAEDKHLDTVEKLKKRSERFKLSMPSEKDAIATKKMESEPSLPLGPTETGPDSEIKSVRPPRKRRWTGN